MKTTKEQIKINKNVKRADFELAVSAEILNNMGWRFEDCDFLRELIPNKNGNEIERLKKFEDTEIDYTIGDWDNSWCVVITIIDNFQTTYRFEKWTDFAQKMSHGQDEDTGDNDQTIKDVIKILGSDQYFDYKDYSLDKNDCHQPLFEGFDSMQS